MTVRGKPRGFSLMDLIVGMMLVGMALAMIVPRGQGTKDAATTKVTAEELVARFRQARQTAMTKSVPVAVAFPKNGTTAATDEAFFLEGEVNPKVSERWKIQQPRVEVAYYTGTWSGPTWAAADVMETANKNFDLSTWFGPVSPPPAELFVFTPSGNVVSDALAADGKFRVVVGMGLQGTATSLTAATTPFTVWISPTGEVGLERGVYGNPTIYASVDKGTANIASFVSPAVSSNVPPVVTIIPPMTVPGAKAYPNSVNPKTKNGNIIAIDAVLTLEVRVKDDNGDPPYFKWRTTEAAVLDDDGTSFIDQTDMDTWGGRFSNVGEVRMEWDAETQEWVGRDTWAAATGDKGGNRYRLECEIRDRKGGTVTTGFPVDGNYLVTSNEPWVLYRTWNAQNRSELWKMTLDGLEHTLVCSFPYQDVYYGQWAPSGAEIIVGAADGVYRVSSDGGAKKLIAPVNLGGGTLDGCCLSPSGEAVYFVYGREYEKKIREVYINGSGVQRTVTLAPDEVSDPNPFNNVGPVYDLSSAKFGSKTVLLCTYYHYNKDNGFLGLGIFTKKKKRQGAMAIDASNGSHTSYDKPPTWTNVAQNGKYPPYGISFATTKDTSVYENVHVLYGSAGGQIYIHGTTPSVSPIGLGPAIKVLNTGRADVHHPRYATPDLSSIVFVAGRNQAATIYHMPDINNPGNNYPLPLAPVNIGAEQPSVSRPRPRN